MKLLRKILITDALLFIIMLIFFDLKDPHAICPLWFNIWGLFAIILPALGLFAWFLYSLWKDKI